LRAAFPAPDTACSKLHDGAGRVTTATAVPDEVSRGERNEYHGVTLDRANRIAEALGATIHNVVEALDEGPV
jgi:hypothetical protein